MRKQRIGIRGEKACSRRICRRISAGVLAAVLSLGGFAAAPRTAEAAETGGTVFYDSSYKLADYWAKGAAPVKAGYVFGGWYADQGTLPLTEETAKTFTGTAYAKFVPDYVLSVKAQNQGSAAANDGATSLRLITSADSRNYKNMGITVLLNKTVDRSPEPTSKVYGGLEAGAGAQQRTAKEIFGSASSYLAVWQLDGIEDANDKKSIYIRPYWTTLDGTRVEGLARYLHVEDGYMDYLSIPINLMTGDAVAAGALQITCSDPRFELLDVEEGEIFAEMESNRISESTVRIVGNAPTVNQPVKAAGIFASVRFKLKKDMEYIGGKSDPVTFTIQGEDFCDWQERTVTVDVADVWY